MAQRVPNNNASLVAWVAQAVAYHGDGRRVVPWCALYGAGHCLVTCKRLSVCLCCAYSMALARSLKGPGGNASVNASVVWLILDGLPRTAEDAVFLGFDASSRSATRESLEQVAASAPPGTL